jgi:carboxypeptidase C (cathepsin A)
MRSRTTSALPLALLLGLALPPPSAALAQEPRAASDAEAREKESEKPKDEKPPEEKLSVTKHVVSVGGKRIDYTATAGTYLLREEDGTPKVSLFFVAYTKDGEPPERRPVTFSFNGGPGSSSVWLHLGLFGPRRVDLGPEGFARADEAKLVPNEQSLLDLSDFVFVDPVTTGYSRAVPGVDEKKYHGIREDIELVGEFVRLFTTRTARWASPKFLAGESYGTTRVSGLVDWLQDRHGLYIDGVILVSAILNFQTGDFHVGNDLPYLTFLPTYTATAWYHRRLPPDLQAKSLAEAVEEARRFAGGEYQLALYRGAALEPGERHALAEKLARLTGLPVDFVLRANLRIEDRRFFKELQRERRKTTGRLDSRFVGVDLDAAGEEAEGDPSYAAIQGPYSAALNDYLRRELKAEFDLPYEILTGRVRPWSYREFENRYVDVADRLRQAMRKNPALEVFVANGYYDLATPFHATEHTFAGLDQEGDLPARIRMRYYEAGHMMYIHRGELAKLRADLERFYREVLAR